MKQLIFAGFALGIAAATFATAASADTIAASGTFTGLSDHITTGGVTIVETSGGGSVVILNADFSLDGAPDPSVGFGINGEYVAASDLGELTSINGLQAYPVPAGLDVTDFTEVFIWCDEFSVPLGVAALSNT
ncbi:DM13 domain-containing protein [Gymnodinialimonas hymeniacidonis]|uniref:DM13 domain-containing protein n=1 Tax=Gymnodinialimonas hymeniacidonis TaxID=3126508 RepID=UPI0034C6A909